MFQNEAGRGLFLCLQNVNSREKGGLTQNFLYVGAMDIFWNYALNSMFIHTYIHTYIQFIEAPFPGLFSHNILTKTNKYTERIELNY